MNRHREYKSKLVSAKEAVKAIKSGDRVAIPLGADPDSLLQALLERKDELRDVEIMPCGHRGKFNWLQFEGEKSFTINFDLLTGDARLLLDRKQADYSPFLFSLAFKAGDEQRLDSKKIDVLLVVVSPPDKHGFCSFGNSLYNKRSIARRARTVLAEADSSFIRTYGDNFIHVSEIDYLVERAPNLQLLPQPKVDEVVKAIAEQVSTLIRDGDTIQLGPGSATEPLPMLGIFDNKHDLGCHSAAATEGLVKAVKAGIITGRRKTLHPGKAVAGAFYGDEDDLRFMDGNPMFELYDLEYVNDLRTIAAHDNMVAINNAIAVDLTGQINCDSVGPQMRGGSGGQPEFAMGSVLSHGGRSLTVLPSTAAQGKVSRIVTFFEPGTVVSIPRSFADYVVTEYGIARLLGKSLRQRAEELIAVAHPDFRPELKKQSQKLLYP